MSTRLPCQDVITADRCVLSALDASWPFARDHHSAIDAYWQRRSTENPQFFNGRIRMVRNFEINDRVARGALIETEFKSFLYWREHGEPEAGVRDCFASAILVSLDRAVLLVQQRPGNINSGLTYLPGGFIDARDVAGDGAIDIAASAAREVLEETGLGPVDLTVLPGFQIYQSAAQVAIAVVFEARETAEVLQAKVRAHIEKEPDGELQHAVLVRSLTGLAAYSVPPYAQALLTAHFSEP